MTETSSSSSSNHVSVVKVAAILISCIAAIYIFVDSRPPTSRPTAPGDTRRVVDPNSRRSPRGSTVVNEIIRVVTAAPGEAASATSSPPGKKKDFDLDGPPQTEAAKKATADVVPYAEQPDANAAVKEGRGGDPLLGNTAGVPQAGNLGQGLGGGGGDPAEKDLTMDAPPGEQRKPSILARDENAAHLEKGLVDGEPDNPDGHGVQGHVQAGEDHPPREEQQGDHGAPQIDPPPPAEHAAQQDAQYQEPEIRPAHEGRPEGQDPAKDEDITQM